MMLALCLTTTAAKAQVVYGDDEKNYARTTGSSMPMSATNHNLQQQPSISDGNTRFHLSGIGDNWFASVQAGTSTFLGAPKGCGDFYDKTNTPWCLVLVNGTLVSSEHVLCTRDFSLSILTRNL